MGKTGSWFSKVKKVLSTEAKEMAEQKPVKVKKKWFGKRKDLHKNSPSEEAATSVSVPSCSGNVKFSGLQNEQRKNAFSVAVATTVAAGDTFASARALPLTSVSQNVEKTEEAAAIKIQTAFRGHMAKRALRALKGLVRLKSMINGQSVQRQATTTLHYMQTLAHVQSQIRARRSRIKEENQILKRQLLQKHEKELERLRSFGGEDWNDSQQSKEKIEERLLSKQQATMKRERALAYAYSRQTLKNKSKPEQLTFLDPSNPQWGWSWLERWMAARPWESHIISDKQLYSDQGSLKSWSDRKPCVGGISKGYYTRTDSSLDSNNQTLDHLIANYPANLQSPSSLPTKTLSSSSTNRKIRSASTKVSGGWARDENSRSWLSVQSERYHRHSVLGSSVTYDETLVSTPSVPSYMAPTASVKARSRLSLMDSNKKGSPLKVSSFGSYQKNLSFTASPGVVRRHSGQPLVRGGNQ